MKINGEGFKQNYSMDATYLVRLNIQYSLYYNVLYCLIVYWNIFDV